MESQVGYERLFDPQDIFFSTTDLKGVIQNTNRTFDTLSRYSRERLIGAPHNIIRHLDMPAGLFRLIWDDLQSQRPACGYITNRAVDGLDYRVFATIVPLRQGFLSVRIKPMDNVTRGQGRGGLPAGARQGGATFRPAAPRATSSVSSAAESWPQSSRHWASPPCTT